MPLSRKTLDEQAIAKSDDFIAQFKASVTHKKPYDNIIDFVRHKDFCGLRLYPRQETIMKLIYLETELMTDYDLEVIDGWTKTFGRDKESYGVQPDIWDRIAWLKERGYDHFPHVQSVMGRRAGKGMLGGIIGAERIANLIALDDPQAHFGLNVEALYLSIIATSQTQAKNFLFADVRKTVTGNKWLSKYISTNKDHMLTFQTPADVRRIAKMRAQGIPLESEIASVRAMPMSSSSAGGRGGSNFFLGFDEFAHGLQGTEGDRDSANIYSSFTPALDQLGKDAMIYMPSSPWSKAGIFYDLYVSGKVLTKDYMDRTGLWTPQEIDEAEKELDAEEGLEQLTADPEMLIIQLPSWEPYLDWEKGPKLVGTKFKRAIQVPPWGDSPENLKMARLKKRNPTKFKVEREAQFAEVIDAYLDADKVDAAFEPWNGRVLEQQRQGRLDFVYHGHSDPSRTNCSFAIAVGHLEQAQDQDEFGHRWWHVVFDYTHVYNPADYEDHTVDYVQIENDLEDLFSRFPALKEFTFDGWNSAGFIAQLTQWAATMNHGVRVHTEDFTNKRNQEVAEKFKSALNLGWVHIPRDTLFNNGEGCLAEQELKFLMERNGVVQKQSVGPVTTKDLADCIMAVTVRLLTNQLDHWHRTQFSAIRPEFGLNDGWPESGSQRRNVVRKPLEGRNIDPERAARNRNALDSFKTGRGVGARTWGR